MLARDQLTCNIQRAITHVINYYFATQKTKKAVQFSINILCVSTISYLRRHLFLFYLVRASRVTIFVCQLFSQRKNYAHDLSSAQGEFKFQILTFACLKSDGKRCFSLEKTTRYQSFILTSLSECNQSSSSSLHNHTS